MGLVFPRRHGGAKDTNAGFRFEGTQPIPPDAACLLEKRSGGEAFGELLDAQLVPHGLHLIAKVIGVEHPGASLGLAASDRGKPFILFGQCDFNFDLFQFDFGHLK